MTSLRWKVLHTLTKWVCCYDNNNSSNKYSSVYCQAVYENRSADLTAFSIQIYSD